MATTYCINDPCETESITERDDSPYCFTCAEAYDRGYEAGYAKVDESPALETLKRAFPWLGTDDNANGADVVDRLNELYEQLGN